VLPSVRDLSPRPLKAWPKAKIRKMIPMLIEKAGSTGLPSPEEFEHVVVLVNPSDAATIQFEPAAGFDAEE
jgi:hypothetical protein